MPLPATVTVPDFLILQQREMKILFNDLRNPLFTQLYMLLVIHADFNTGELQTNYARLEELCTPPVREKGGRGKGPTLRQIRYALEQLIEYNLVKRNAEKNASQGMLRLFVRKRKTTAKKRTP